KPISELGHMRGVSGSSGSENPSFCMAAYGTSPHSYFITRLPSSAAGHGTPSNAGVIGVAEMRDLHLCFAPDWLRIRNRSSLPSGEARWGAFELQRITRPRQ